MIEEIQVFETVDGQRRVKAAYIGYLKKVNEKTVHVEHVLDVDADGFKSPGCGKVMLVYPKLASWQVQVRVLIPGRAGNGGRGEDGGWVIRHENWDRRVGLQRNRAFDGHNTGDRPEFVSGNGKAKGYGVNR